MTLNPRLPVSEVLANQRVDQNGCIELTPGLVQTSTPTYLSRWGWSWSRRAGLVRPFLARPAPVWQLAHNLTFKSGLKICEIRYKWQPK